VAHAGFDKRWPVEIQGYQPRGYGQFMLFRNPRERQAHRMKVLLLLLAGLTAPALAQDLEADYTTYGRLVVTQFVTAPFPHASRTNGHTYKDKFFPADRHYRDSTVAIFIPKSFRAMGPVDVVVHFHGWGNSVAGTLKQFDLVQQFVASGRNAVLVVPEGPREASDSAGGKLEDAGGFARFVNELQATLAGVASVGTNASVGKIILSGHSGGYRVMAAILDRGGVTPQIREVWLFDGLYADADKYQAWVDQAGGRLLNIYTDGGGTKDDSEAMLKWLEQNKVKFLATEDTRVTVDELKTNRVVFLHTDLGHNDVLAKRKTFQQFAETSCLNPHPPR
jgi:hypothetical protein